MTKQSRNEQTRGGEKPCGAVDDAAKFGNLSMRLGLGWAKSLSFATGQCPVMKYHRNLMQAILFDKIAIDKAVGVEAGGSLFARVFAAT